MSTMNNILLSLVLLTGLSACQNPPKEVKEDKKELASNQYETTYGVLEFENGFEKGVPTDESNKKLRHLFDLNNAATAYTWGQPIVAMYEVKRNFEEVLNAGNGDIVLFTGVDRVRPFLTSNNSTPYILSVIDLGVSGPMVIELPAGALLGFADDAWQRPIIDIGVTGKNQGKGDKVVIYGPGQETPNTDMDVAESKTNFVFMVYRVLSQDEEEKDRLLSSIKHYPLKDAANPPATNVITAEEKQTWRESQPRGMRYWEVLNTAIQNEPVEERDRFIHGMMMPLGIAKGNDFNPNQEQTKILEEAVFLGEAMLKTLTFDKRFESRVWREGSQWEHMMCVLPYQRTEYTDQFEERGVWFYEATTMSESYLQKLVGTGTKYLTAYKDGDGDFLDGAKNYVMNVPADVPVKLFWDVSVYANDGRIYIENETGVVNIGSRTKDVKKNDDGSTNIYFGPNPPSEELRSNWIETNKGENWFSVFRFYGPLEPFYDGSFTLPDIQKSN